ncbi:MAG: hypothetical protein EKK29_01330 [Hyphomicrobiales bacterium]|nr:MAG: hypothetical protein EKK29_01330 [Hyphomicrobiales bacterium]
MAAKGFADKPTPYKASTSATSKAFAGSGRTPPGPDAASLRRIAEGAVGRDLQPGAAKNPKVPMSQLTPEAVRARKEGQN